MNLKLSALFTTLALGTLASANASELTVIHGINGADLGLPAELPVNIAVNRDCALESVEFGQSATLEVDPGLYSIRVYLADSKNGERDRCEGTLVLSKVIDVAFGENASIIAHLTDDATITATKFVNDVRAASAGNGRVIVRHTADAPAVDVYAAADLRLFADLTNSEQGKADVPSATYSVSVNPAGSDDTVFGPVDLFVPAHTVTAVYAVGSLGTGTFTVILQSIPL